MRRPGLQPCRTTLAASWWTLACLVALLGAAGMMRAEASTGSALYQQGQARYAAGDWLGAARLYEQALSAGYTKSAAYYKLGLAFAHLKQWDGVVWAMQTLQQKDPTYARSHALVAQRIAEAQAAGGVNRGMPVPAAGGAGSSAGGHGSSSGSSSGPGPGSATARDVTAALASSDVYVAPAMAGAVGASGLSALQSDASTLRDKGTPTKYVILSGVPTPYTTLGQFTEALFTALGLKHAVVVAVDPHSVAAWSDRLSRADLQDLTNASRARFLNGTYVAGATALAHSIVDKADTAQATASAGRALLIVVVLLIVALVVSFVVLARWRRWQRGYREAMSWRDAVAALEEEVSTDVQYLPAGDARHGAFAAGAEYYGKAAAALDGLGHQSPFAIAFAGGPRFRALGEARLNLQEAEGRLREAGATGPGIAGTAARTAPRQAGRAAPRAFRDASAVAPTPAQAACFFCGRPLDPATAEAVFVPVGNQQRRVLVCDEHGTAVRAGRQPPVRTFQSQSLGRQVPWWAAPEYNPYRDYDPSYYQRGGGIGWGDLLLFETLFNRPTTNVVYVDDDRWQGGDVGAYDQAGRAAFASDHPDAGSFDTGTRDMPSAPEAAFAADGGGWDAQGDRS